MEVSSNDSQNHSGLHRVQAAQLQYHQEQEELPGSSGNEEVLPFLQEAYAASRNEVRKAAGTMADKTEKKANIFVRAAGAVKRFFGRIVKFFRDTKSELKKVVWPSRKDTKNNTIVVLVVVGISAVVMIALDAAFGGIMSLIIGA
jgi:preprotein translocase subunit SecE